MNKLVNNVLFRAGYYKTLIFNFTINQQAARDSQNRISSTMKLVSDSTRMEIVTFYRIVATGLRKNREQRPNDLLINSKHEI